MKMDARSALKLAKVRFGPGLDPPVLLLSVWSMDLGTGLWTSHYVVDNQLGNAVVTDVAILVDSVHKNFDLHPSRHTEPTGWEFNVAESGSTYLPPVNEFGTFWDWHTEHTEEGVAPGSMSPPFSVTWPWPWSVGEGPCWNNNYFLWSPTPGVGSDPHPGMVGYGNAFVPDFGRGCSVT
jgi:hypothetical protein